MTLAEFYATHRSPQAIIVPRRVIRVATTRPAAEALAASAVDPAALLPAGGDAGKKH